MIKQILIVLTEPICNCKKPQFHHEIDKNTMELCVYCNKCKREVRASINDRVFLRVIPVIEGKAKVISFKEAKKEKDTGGIVD